MFAVHLIVIAVLVGHALDCLWRRCADRVVFASATRLQREISALRHQAAELNAPSTFARSSKLEREAASKEAELHVLQQAIPRWRAWVPDGGSVALRYGPLAGAAAYAASAGSVAAAADIPVDWLALRPWGGGVGIFESAVLSVLALRGFNKAVLRHV
ncbi:hypothetical protein DIPPA_12338 [Diplonema papillatum]|nr:hypothetical protein DIPPA_12338 [Diplonema papillatum]